MADPQALSSHPNVERRCFAPMNPLTTAADVKAVASHVAASAIVVAGGPSSSNSNNKNNSTKNNKRRSRNMSLARIQRELKEIERDPPPFCWVGLKQEDATTTGTKSKRQRIDDNDAEILSVITKKKNDAYANWVDSHHYWEVMMNGPNDTPYEGGIFFLDIILPERYPFEAPQIKFTTPIYHCNIRASDGQICCLDLLNLEWRPALSVSVILQSIVSLLMYPETSDDTVSDKERLELFTTDRAKFNEKAREWTRKYAM